MNHKYDPLIDGGNPRNPGYVAPNTAYVVPTVVYPQMYVMPQVQAQTQTQVQVQPQPEETTQITTTVNTAPKTYKF